MAPVSDHPESNPADVPPQPERTGIEEPPGFAEEAKRFSDFHNLKSLHDIRMQLEGKTGIDSEL